MSGETPKDLSAPPKEPADEVGPATMPAEPDKSENVGKSEPQISPAIPSSAPATISSSVPAISSSSLAVSSPAPAVLSAHTQHIRIPTVPTAIQRTLAASSVQVHSKPATITLARPITNPVMNPVTTFTATGHHRLPMAPIITSISNSSTSMVMGKVNAPKTSPISLAVIQQQQQDVMKSGNLNIIFIVYIYLSQC